MQCAATSLLKVLKNTGFKYEVGRKDKSKTEFADGLVTF